MRLLPITATDEEIKTLIVEWSELLAQKKFREALEMFDQSPEEENWTPDFLQAWISNYGYDEPVRSGEKFEITSLLKHPDKAEIIANKIDVDRENLYGLNAKQYQGMVHYDDIPLNGERSDLTARFCIKRVGNDLLTLEFLDIHVM